MNLDYALTLEQLEMMRGRAQEYPSSFYILDIASCVPGNILNRPRGQYKISHDRLMNGYVEFAKSLCRPTYDAKPMGRHTITAPLYLQMTVWMDNHILHDAELRKTLYNATKFFSTYEEQLTTLEATVDGLKAGKRLVEYRLNDANREMNKHGKRLVMALADPRTKVKIAESLANYSYWANNPIHDEYRNACFNVTEAENILKAHTGLNRKTFGEILRKAWEEIQSGSIPYRKIGRVVKPVSNLGNFYLPNKKGKN